MSLDPNSPSSFRLTSYSLQDTFTWLSKGISKLIYLSYDFLPFLFFLFSVTASIFSESNKNPGVTFDSSLSLPTLIYNPSMSPVYSTSKTCPSTSLQVHSHCPDPSWAAAGLQSPLCVFEKRCPSCRSSLPEPGCLLISRAWAGFQLPLDLQAGALCNK